MITAAKKGIQQVIDYEPNLSIETTPLHLYIQTDSKGKTGDVRDIVCIKPEENWQIGISCKNNHHAVKHSRLSPKIDFGKSWMNVKNTDQYRTDTLPVWNFLKNTIEENPDTKWSDLKEYKETLVYAPLLEAFSNELRILCKDTQNIKNLFYYLLGSYDFYKVIANKTNKNTEVMIFNLYGTLNKSVNGIKPKRKVHKTLLPSRLYSIEPAQDKKGVSPTTIKAVFDDWSLSFRIHNARTLVENSLKFDINLKSVPTDLQNIISPWE
ncbi:HaeIII family restriction endonuclease [Latilactobacillus curvatus]|nr:HaeIII family restriction endonuclease [Latilactobacillus curvatus]MDG2981848.1 HaeIII family restriction endonuclease [Latilactobacillus curvatus]